MKLAMGRTVIVKAWGESFNGFDEAPAIITRVWGTGDTSDGPQSANLMLLPDCSAPHARTSVSVYDSKELALAGCMGQTVAWVPERV